MKKGDKGARSQCILHLFHILFLRVLYPLLSWGGFRLRDTNGSEVTRRETEPTEERIEDMETANVIQRKPLRSVHSLIVTAAGPYFQEIYTWQRNQQKTMKCRKEIKGNTVHLLFPGLVMSSVYESLPVQRLPQTGTRMIIDNGGSLMPRSFTWFPFLFRDKWYGMRDPTVKEEWRTLQPFPCFQRLHLGLSPAFGPLFSLATPLLTVVPKGPEWAAWTTGPKVMNGERHRRTRWDTGGGPGNSEATESISWGLIWLPLESLSRLSFSLFTHYIWTLEPLTLDLRKYLTWTVIYLSFMVFIICS